MMPTRALSIRLPEDLFEDVRSLSLDRGTSVNQLVQDGLKEMLAQNQYERLCRAFDELADDPKECDVSYAIEAQREVIMRDE